LALTEMIPALSSEVALAVRVGIATGHVVVGDIIGEGAAQESAVVGETPNLAARLQGIAEPNHVMVSDLTWKLTRGYFEFEPLPPQPIKGFQEAVRVYRVMASREIASRFAATVVDGVKPRLFAAAVKQCRRAALI
jgi:class 3 adenylate cyclase